MALLVDRAYAAPSIYGSAWAHDFWKYSRVSFPLKTLLAVLKKRFLLKSYLRKELVMFRITVRLSVVPSNCASPLVVAEDKLTPPVYAALRPGSKSLVLAKEPTGLPVTCDV